MLKANRKVPKLQLFASVQDIVNDNYRQLILNYKNRPCQIAHVGDRISKIRHMRRRWGTPQNFCLAFIDELKKQLLIKITVKEGQ